MTREKIEALLQGLEKTQKSAQRLSEALQRALQDSRGWLAPGVNPGDKDPEGEAEELLKEAGRTAMISIMTLREGIEEVLNTLL